ncbi:energy-coupling factor transport system ATP-binding protein [Bacillus oleivorans]|uniref:Energy-coupling factor transporter ATP-binding protein EcfA2 n=1 Tax=Bacillus oleivorans TaxID=1448271 RepID=A0A285D7K6_9BACI|nr:energy-coupling factor ABC transporter ATP-binding protein [Bacillus oleivorans]SNX75615.1 energy-coupling factor transport system ATP-binding protein [Bacillus oleivorans]
MDIILEQVEYKYQPGTPFERIAIHDINIDIPSGTFMAIIGHTGSGKSTVLQHLNALLKPTKGKVRIGDRVIEAGIKESNLKPIRQKVGIVFQFPEHQLFDETVLKDVCFGPMNYGVSEQVAEEKAIRAIKQVGLTEDILNKSPFDLSGGQMRRVAIAGVLAMEPDVIVLDEPTAGLDPRGRKEIMEMFKKLHEERNLSTVLVTHSMEDASQFADQITVMHKGTVIRKGTPAEIFASPEELIDLGLDVPEVVKFRLLVEGKLGITFPKPSMNMEELAVQIAQYVKEGSLHD